mmetsp:Transcript_76501/g.192528  ORF Transcript_76501/g.192528 Transcript_76501/m.192528 type:complete len:194 (+) Transcript_76501:79-660(+)
MMAKSFSLLRVALVLPSLLASAEASLEDSNRSTLPGIMGIPASKAFLQPTQASQGSAAVVSASSPLAAEVQEVEHWKDCNPVGVYRCNGQCLKDGNASDVPEEINTIRSNGGAFYTNIVTAAPDFTETELCTQVPGRGLVLKCQTSSRSDFDGMPDVVEEYIFEADKCGFTKLVWGTTPAPVFTCSIRCERSQ